MKNSSLKKIAAFLLSTMMLVGILAGCGTTPAAPTTAPQETVSIKEPTAIGMLMLNANANVELLYDEEGLVLAAEGIDENGVAIVTALGDPLGQSCSQAMSALIQHSMDSGFITDDVKTVIVKQALASQQPNDTFLQNLDAELQAVAEAVTVITVSVDDLDSNGYIGTDKAKEILAAELGLADTSAIEGNPSINNDTYTFTVATALLTEYYAVNGNTGAVSESSPEANPDAEPDVSPDETMFDSTTPATLETIPESIPDDTLPEEDPVMTETEPEEVQIPEETEAPQTIPEDI